MSKMFYTLEETASVLGISESDVKLLVDRCLLRLFRDRDKFMFKTEEVDTLVSNIKDVLNGINSPAEKKGTTASKEDIINKNPLVDDGEVRSGRPCGRVEKEELFLPKKFARAGCLDYHKDILPEEKKASTEKQDVEELTEDDYRRAMLELLQKQNKHIDFIGSCLGVITVAVILMTLVALAFLSR